MSRTHMPGKGKRVRSGRSGVPFATSLSPFGADCDQEENLSGGFCAAERIDQHSFEIPGVST